DARPGRSARPASARPLGHPSRRRRSGRSRLAALAHTSRFLYSVDSRSLLPPHVQSRPPDMDLLGTKLSDRYEIVRELGRGGMGVVYLARDPLLDRDVAVKLVPPHLLGADAGERFRREARVVAKMDHPSVVTIYD